MLRQTRPQQNNIQGNDPWGRYSMLKRFVYLDEQQLGQYMAVLEGGLVVESKTRAVRSGGGSGGANVKSLQGEYKKGHEDEESWTRTDPPEAQFERLLAAADENPETLDWLEIMEPDADFPKAAIGTMISWECDVYVPLAARLIASRGDGLMGLHLIRTLGSLAESQGAQLPKDWNAGLIDATEEMVKRVDARLVVVGDDEDTKWKVGGALFGDHLLTPDIDRRAVIVGKVTQRLEEGHWRQIMNLAKQSLVNRQKRREQARQPPPQGKEDNFLSGPALVLDVVAIYR